MVGVTGFEPVTPGSRSQCATELRYTPPRKFRKILTHGGFHATGKKTFPGWPRQAKESEPRYSLSEDRNTYFFLSVWKSFKSSMITTPPPPVES